MTKDELLEFLYSALRSPRGTLIETDDAERLRQRLYAIRREQAEFVNLSFVISPANGRDLWIVNKGPADGQD